MRDNTVRRHDYKWNRFCRYRCHSIVGIAAVIWLCATSAGAGYRLLDCELPMWYLSAIIFMPVCAVSNLAVVKLRLRDAPYGLEGLFCKGLAFAKASVLAAVVVDAVSLAVLLRFSSLAGASLAAFPAIPILLFLIWSKTNAQIEAKQRLHTDDVVGRYCSQYYIGRDSVFRDLYMDVILSEYKAQYYLSSYIVPCTAVLSVLLYTECLAYSSHW